MLGITRGVVNTFLRIACKVNVDGFERVPLAGSLIVAANHLHSFDPFLVDAFFPRKVVVLARANAYRFPPLAWFLRMCGAFPIRRGQADQRALDWSLEILKLGYALGIFPEGRCQHDSGLAAAKTGVALLACRTGAPILPIAITGTEILSRWSKIRGKIEMGLRIGSVLKLETDSEPSPERLRLITDELMFRIASLLPLAYRGVYGCEDNNSMNPGQPGT